MPAMKGHSGCQKRFKLTATGKLKHKATGRRHNFSAKSHRRKRALRKDRIVKKSDFFRLSLLTVHL
ncbi:MAG: 50S ribosomal protein L35 [Bacteroidia bacterium]|nr:50S ribosomal protein L35 [Bacteroidia bacterium]MCX7652170.1 50S ribosomal protein L35 [Bacteroidia bacterium]MDW8416432.1 50S ribosomal protein L35 [Bacteroidia bacterium]